MKDVLYLVVTPAPLLHCRRNEPVKDLLRRRVNFVVCKVNVVVTTRAPTSKELVSRGANVYGVRSIPVTYLNEMGCSRGRSRRLHRHPLALRRRRRLRSR